MHNRPTPKVLLIIVFCILIISNPLLYCNKIIDSIASGVLINLLIIIALWLLFLFFIPNEYGKVRLRQFTVALVIAISAFLTFILKIGDSKFVKTIYQSIPLTLKDRLFHTTDSFYLTCIILFIVLTLFLLNFVIKDKTIMGEHSNDFDSLFPERDFNEKLKSFCVYLNNRIESYNTEANWSDAHFTPLEAEVEIQSYKGKIKRISNLLQGIKRNKKDRVFLVLGEPGSGKSVALRTLCKSLIKEVGKTKKIPIYLNLKEWFVEEKWDENNPPTITQLTEFCLSHIKGNDLFADDFIDKYFNRLYENGHIFFILDSFDEIPSVLDVDEASWLIEKLSEVIYNFLGGASESRGVLASRYYRKPTIHFRTNITLNVRPFSDYKINEALNKYIALDKVFINQIFNERTDLLPIASNPFSIGLIYSFVKDNNALPLNQAELFFSYIDKRINSCNKKIEKKGLTKNEVLECAIKIATYMFEKSNFGLEVSLSELKEEFIYTDVDSIIEILVYARIGRIGKGDENRFSFVHRRFNEYFLIQKYLEKPQLIDIESIPQDSRYRDALV